MMFVLKASDQAIKNSSFNLADRVRVVYWCFSEYYLQLAVSETKGPTEGGTPKHRLVEIEVVFKLDPHRNPLAILSCRDESDLASSVDGHSREAMGQSLHGENGPHTPVCRKNRAEHYRSGNLVSPRFSGVSGLGFAQYTRLCADLFS